MPVKLALHFDEMKQRFRGGEQAGLVAVAEEGKFRIIGKLNAPKSGVHYPGQPHINSAPGEAPATQSGELEESIKAQLVSAHAASTFSTDPKAPYLEYGTANMEPRPVWTQTLVE